MTPLATRTVSQSPRKLLAFVWDRLSIYLPILLMGLLALTSAWLLKTTPAPQATASPPQDDPRPDYYMHNFAVRQFGPGGELTTTLRGAQAQHYPSRQSLLVQQAHLSNLSATQRLTTGQALRLSINDAHTHYLLEQGVTIVQHPAPNAPAEPTITYQGNSMLVRTDTNTITSQQPVRILRGQDTITANSMVYQHDLNTMNFHGQVKTTLVARP